MIERYMKGKTVRKVSDTRKRSMEDINRLCSKSVTIKNESDNDVDAGLAEEFFGKVFGGNPETGEVPGARPMTDKEFYQFAYKALRRQVDDPEEFDKMFNLEELFG